MFLAKAFYRDQCAVVGWWKMWGRKKSTIVGCDASNAGTKTMCSTLFSSMLHGSDRVVFAYMPLGQSCKYGPRVQISIPAFDIKRSNTCNLIHITTVLGSQFWPQYF
jgi:hypothetical protein